MMKFLYWLFILLFISGCRQESYPLDGFSEEQKVLPDAVGKPYPLEGGVTSLDKHMMKNVNKGVEKNFKEKLEIANKILGE